MIYDVAEVNVGVHLGSGGYGSVYSGTTERSVSFWLLAWTHNLL